MNNIPKDYRANKGAITFSDMIVVVLLYIVFMAFLPALNLSVNNTSVQLRAAPNDATELTIDVLVLVPFVIIVALMLSALNQASPQYQMSRK